MSEVLCHDPTEGGERRHLRSGEPLLLLYKGVPDFGPGVMRRWRGDGRKKMQGTASQFVIYVKQGGTKMELKIEIDEKELRKEVTDIIARKLTQSWTSERNMFKRIIAESVREVVYSQKEEIINMVVGRATREIVSKSIPKLLDKLTDK